MQTMTRAQLQKAIEAGIEGAEGILEDADIEALREVGRTTEYVDSNFGGEYGCPATQAGLFVEDLNDCRDLHFATGYDRKLHELGVSIFGSLRITD